MIRRMRQLAAISTSAKCATISAIDHFPGAGCHFSCFGVRPVVSFLSFGEVVCCTLIASWPSTWPRIRWMYCCAVSGIFSSRQVFITITLRQLLSPNPAAARQTAQLFDGVDYGAGGYVTGNFDLADFAGQNEVHHTVLRFFVQLQPGQNFARADIDLRQAAEA